MSSMNRSSGGAGTWPTYSTDPVWPNSHGRAAPRFLSSPSAVSTGMDAIKEMYARWAAGDMGEDDQWGDVTAEPRGLDYTEVSADGVPAMWLVPHGADLDPAIVALHG